MSSLLCPLCSASLSASSLEAHLRFELALPLFRCARCPQSFVDRRAAQEHFEGPWAEHPGSQPLLIRPPSDPAKSDRLLELLRLARGGPDAIDRRLCVCGQCRILCRDDAGLFSDLVRVQPNYLSSSRQAADPAEESEQENGPNRRPDGLISGFAVPETPDEPAQDTLRAIEESQINPEPETQPQARLGSTENLAKTMHETSLDEPQEPEPHELKPEVTDETKAFLSPLEEEEPLSSEESSAMPQLELQPVSDGRVSCSQCGTRVDKNALTSHVESKHVEGRPFQCLLCPGTFKRRNHLVSHQLTTHGRTTTPKTFLRSTDKAIVRELVRECFGDARGAGYKSIRCGPCDTPVRSQELRRHVATRHLREPLHRCLLCGKTSFDTSPGDVKKHIVGIHKQRPGRATLDSAGFDRHLPTIKAMVLELFRQ